MTDAEYTKIYRDNLLGLRKSLVWVGAALAAMLFGVPLSAVGLLPLAFAVSAGFMAYFLWQSLTGGSDFGQATLTWLRDSYGMDATKADVTTLMNGGTITSQGKAYAPLKSTGGCRLVEI